MQKLNLRMQKLNFPGTHWRGLALMIGAQKTCEGMHKTFYPFFLLKGQNNQGNFWQKTQQTGKHT